MKIFARNLGGQFESELGGQFNRCVQPEKEKRIKVVYFDNKMDDKYKKKLKFFEALYTKDK